MALETGGDERVRVWVLADVASWEQGAEIAQALYEDLGHKGGDRYVVVRADVGRVGRAGKIVIPVDAEDQDAWHEVKEKIVGYLGEELTIVQVTGHFPYPPHIAHGYISHAERNAQRELGTEIEEELKAGRQGDSPGHNPWG